jgi:hypothetical protein
LIKQAEGAGDVDVVIERKEAEDKDLPDEQKTALSGDDVREIYDVYIVAGGTANELKPTGKLIIGLPYKLSGGETAGGVIVFYVDDNGKMSPMADTRYDEAKKLAMFTTNHFSIYAVTYWDRESAGGGGGGCDTGMSGFALLALMAAAFTARAANRKR